ncbi:hypothetical protein GCM10009641_45890 [Mycobacterium cookii]|uniref:Secreted protein n=1 Tax=Nocardioides furvisabuli TaxID=375542 RepID=A0ABN2XSL5_9ACTN
MLDWPPVCVVDTVRLFGAVVCPVKDKVTTTPPTVVLVKVVPLPRLDQTSVTAGHGEAANAGAAVATATTGTLHAAPLTTLRRDARRPCASVPSSIGRTPSITSDPPGGHFVNYGRDALPTRQ